MPSIRYVNQSAPFWDFVASLENQGPSHPSAETRENHENRESSDEEGPRGWGRPHSWGGPHPWGGPRGWHRGPPHWGRHGPHPHFGAEDGRPHPPPPHVDGQPPHPPHGGPPPPPPPHHEGHPPPPPPAGGAPPPPPPPGAHPESATSPPVEGEPSSPPRHGGPHPHHRRGHCGRRGGHAGGFGRGGWGHGPFSWGPGPFGMGGRPFDFEGMAEAFQKQFFGSNNDEQGTGQGDFKPEADVFDTETSYVIHVSLPGAKKEDVGVSWDAEKSELCIAGVIHRPGDEDFIKTLALDERKVGAFERKIRLGSRANPAQIDDDAITAKLEEGILRVEVPKLDKDYVEIKKVDIL